MTTQPTPTAAQHRSVQANGIDIHHVEAGQGEPLVLLHGGMVSTNPIWAPTPVSYSAHMDQLAETPPPRASRNRPRCGPCSNY